MQKLDNYFCIYVLILFFDYSHLICCSKQKKKDFQTLFNIGKTLIVFSFFPLYLCMDLGPRLYEGGKNET